MHALLVVDPGFIDLKRNLFDSAIMQTSVISDESRQRCFSDFNDSESFERYYTIVLEGQRITIIVLMILTDNLTNTACYLSVVQTRLAIPAQLKW